MVVLAHLRGGRCHGCSGDCVDGGVRGVAAGPSAAGSVQALLTQEPASLRRRRAVRQARPPARLLYRRAPGHAPTKARGVPAPFCWPGVTQHPPWPRPRRGGACPRAAVSRRARAVHPGMARVGKPRQKSPGPAICPGAPCPACIPHPAGHRGSAAAHA